MDEQEATKFGGEAEASLHSCNRTVPLNYVGLLQPKTVPEKPDGFERMKSLVANPI